jgi:DNA-binding transcriptional regulator YhcF (GntR family)
VTEEVIYVIGAEGVNTVKIGTTGHLSRRLRDIQRMSPLPLNALWTHPGGRDLEAHLHKHFKNRRRHGEWFEFDSNPVQLVQWAVQNEPWLRPKVTLKRAVRIPRATTAPVRTPSPRRDGKVCTPARPAPLYLKVAEHIREEIGSGVLAPDSKTAALHVYAAQFGVSQETVKRACRELETLGLLVHSSGGYYVASGDRPVVRPDLEAARARLEWAR